MKIPLVIACLLLAGCTAPAEPIVEQAPADPDEGPAFVPPAFQLTQTPGESQGLEWVVGGTSEAGIQLDIMRGDEQVHTEELAGGPWSVALALSTYGLTEHTLLATGEQGSLSFKLTVNALAPATVQVDHGPGSDREPVDDAIWVDVTSYAAQAMYDDRGAKHSEYVNSHDVMVAWEDATDNEVVYDYFEAQAGFAVSSINGVGNALDAGAGPYWCYTINGEDGGGISVDRFEPGDVINWALCGL